MLGFLEQESYTHDFEGVIGVAVFRVGASRFVDNFSVWTAAVQGSLLLSLSSKKEEDADSEEKSCYYAANDYACHGPG